MAQHLYSTTYHREHFKDAALHYYPWKTCSHHIILTPRGAYNHVLHTAQLVDQTQANASLCQVPITASLTEAYMNYSVLLKNTTRWHIWESNPRLYSEGNSRVATPIEPR